MAMFGGSTLYIDKVVKGGAIHTLAFVDLLGGVKNSPKIMK